MNYSAFPPAEIRALIRAGKLDAPTTGCCDGYAQGNLVVLPKALAWDFLLFCQRNPKACPLLEVADAGERSFSQFAPGSDIAQDIPRYRIYQNGELTEETIDVVRYFEERSDLVSFLIGCSFSFESALLDADIPVRQIEEGVNVPMYNTNIPCTPAGVFSGNMVVSMRPIPHAQVPAAVAITAGMPRVHGAPVQIGTPEAIGITDLAHPDYGDAVTIRPGEKVAIVGPSGGGKTTLCNLIPRFYDIDSGEISIDGKNIKSFTLKSLRQQIGIVQQDVYLFSGTVYDNIVYGSLNATKEQVIEAAKLAGADGFIRELKDGYQTYIGERGVKLSGGQKQRISIARVFLKNPAILILDEATSALDNESEYEVAKSLEKLSKGRTTITIAHRLSSIRNSDRILVLTQEGIAEEGNHEALMEKKGIYYQFYTMADRLK